jgi:hypothetical protein
MRNKYFKVKVLVNELNFYAYFRSISNTNMAPVQQTQAPEMKWQVQCKDL